MSTNYDWFDANMELQLSLSTHPQLENVLRLYLKSQTEKYLKEQAGEDIYSQKKEISLVYFPLSVLHLSENMWGDTKRNSSPTPSSQAFIPKGRFETKVPFSSAWG